MSTVKSVVLSCAGIGSRLGLGKTKALMDIDGKTLISRHLDLFKDIEDVRIVVGYQANDVIEEVMRYRNDVIFVYNHNYFDTKTGTSFYLGAKHANDYVIEWDGDLLVHPEDAKKILNADSTDGEFICYSDVMSDEAVMVQTDINGYVQAFSTERGDFEWTGPVCIRKDKLKYTSGHVYGMLEPYLPMKGMKIRSCDIDTYDDYQRALKLIRTWDVSK